MQFTWDVNPVLWKIWGNFGIRYYGLFFSLVFVFGFLLFRWQVKRAGGTEDDAYDILIPAVIGTVVGARFGHVFFYNLQRFLDDPLWLFRVWEGGLASHGALIGLLLAVWYYAWRHGQSYLECLDRFSFSATVATILVRVGNFFNSEIVGRLTHSDWGVRFPLYEGLPAAECPLRHPSQLYEALMGVAVMGLLLLVDRVLGKEKRPRGALAGTFIGGYFLGRFLVEFFKEYQKLSPSSSPLTMGQYLSIPATLLGLAILIYSLKKGVPSHWNQPDPEPKPKSTSPSPKAKGKKKKSRKKK